MSLSGPAGVSYPESLSRRCGTTAHWGGIATGPLPAGRHRRLPESDFRNPAREFAEAPVGSSADVSNGPADVMCVAPLRRHIALVSGMTSSSPSRANAISSDLGDHWTVEGVWQLAEGIHRRRTSAGDSEKTVELGEPALYV